MLPVLDIHYRASLPIAAGPNWPCAAKLGDAAMTSGRKERLQTSPGGFLSRE